MNIAGRNLSRIAPASLFSFTVRKIHIKKEHEIPTSALFLKQSSYLVKLT